MNITLLANRDLASNIALNKLLPALVQNHRLRVFLSSHVGGGSALPAPLQELQFFEQGLFNELLFPLLQDAGQAAHLKSFDRLARAADLPPFETLNGINTEAGLKTLAATKPDLLLSLRYGGILRERAIAIPERGVLNLHSGLLPAYRGVMATFYAMLNGESDIGTTLHYICDAGIDTGDIIGQTRLPLDTRRSYLWNVLQLYPAGVELLLASVEKISKVRAVAHKPQPAGGNYYTFPSADQLHQFGALGLRLYAVEEIIEIAKQYREL